MRFVTNTSSQSRSAVAARLRALGFDAADGEVIAPPAIAGHMLRARDASAALFVNDATRSDFADVREAERPDFVVVGDLGSGWTWSRLNDAFRLLAEDGATLLALGRTRYWRDEGRLWLDAGPLVAALEYAASVTATVIGKPDPAFFEAVTEALGVPAAETLFVGDDIRTDVGAAQAIGMRGALVRTGKFRPADLDAGITPDAVLDSIADLFRDPA